MFTGFIKAVYVHSIYAGTATDPANVVIDFIIDNATRKPVSVTENSKSVFVTFRDVRTLHAYTLPLAYKKYVLEA